MDSESETALNEAPRTTAAQRFLVLVFLAIVTSAGIIQTVVEARRGQWPQAFEIFADKPTASNLRAYEKSLEEASWVARRLRPWMQYARYVLLADAGRKALIGRDGWLFYKPGWDYLVERSGSAKAIDAAGDPGPAEAIINYRNQLDARGIHLVVVIAPNKESVYPDMLSSRASRSRGVLSRQSRDLLTRLRESGIDVVDLFQAYRDARQEPGREKDQPLYLAQDSHWSPLGVELAARAAARTVLERGWARPGHIAYTERPSPVRRVGDVPRMLDVPQIEKRAPAQEVHCVQVVRRDNGKAYEDDLESAIMVLGDSFLRIYEKDEPGSAGFIAHLAAELGQPVTSLVSDGGASTLVRQELCRRPALLKNKRLVIWEFVERDIRFGAEGWQIVPLPPGETAAQTGQRLK